MRAKLLVVALACAATAMPQAVNRTSEEVLNYRVEWRLITAGRVSVQWSPAPDAGWQAKTHVESVGLVSKLYKVEDDYLAEFNRGGCVQAVQTTSSEGNRQRDAKVTFDYSSRKASYLEHDRLKNAVVAQHEIDIPPCTHDVLGGLFALRGMNLEPGQSASVPVSDGKKAVSARVQAQQREEIKVAAGDFKTIRYEAFLFDNVLYHRSAHLYVWLTDDARRLPVQIQVRMPITVGTITLQLEKYE
ncbi:MAG TPA: DUF3108 domain-containing protein [Bryobacteraceae bacterium]|nr:DUF3108 domain-containing protein [Bryobacteraceae bacterium]